jgi:hypothetical protein
VLGETAAEAGVAESKGGGRAGSEDPRGVCVNRGARKGDDVAESAEGGGSGGSGSGSGGTTAAVAGCRPKKTPELIFLVSDTSFLQAGVRFELSADVNRSRAN